MNRLFLFLLLFLFTPFFSNLRAQATEGLDAANRAYTEGHYADAAQLFRQLIADHGYSAPLCYNLGNAEAKASHPGQAMLNYERARYLAPADSDIDHNLQLARKQAGLDPNSYRWWEMALRSICPIAGWLVMAYSVFFLLILISLLVIDQKKMPKLQRTIIRIVFFVGVPTVLPFIFVLGSSVVFSQRIEGVIVATKEATLRLSPFEGAESTGTIPEGELVTVEARHNDFFRVEGRNHHFGWVQAKEIEPIIADSFSVKPAN